MSRYKWNKTTHQLELLSGAGQIDTALSLTSENTVQNKVITQAVNSVSSDVHTLANETSDMVNILGAKNLLPNTATSQVVNGVTFTVNSDGSITANGTAVAPKGQDYVDLKISDINDENLKNGRYILSGCPSGGSKLSYIISYTNNVNFAYIDDGNGIEFTPFDYTQYPSSRVYLMVHDGFTVNNLTFYPMIRPASIVDDTYVPYAMTNAALMNKTVLTSTTHTMIGYYTQIGNEVTVVGEFKATSSDTEEITTNIPVSSSFNKTIAIVGRDTTNGNLIIFWVNIGAGQISTYKHTGTITVNNKIAFSFSYVL